MKFKTFMKWEYEYITPTHLILYMFVALSNTTKQQETLAYTE